MKNVLRALRQRKFQALAATAVVAGAGAVAAIVPAVAASASQAAPATTPRCGNSAVRAWLGVPGDGAAGSFYYQLELSNISGHTCTLYGYPGVSAAGPGGVQMGSAAGRQAGDPEHVVTLANGATAHVLLRIADTGAFSPSACGPKNAIGLKVYPPNDTASQFVPLTFSACSKKGPVFLHVRVTVAGTGIPGYSS
jgi:hypothetical protein